MYTWRKCPSGKWTVLWNRKALAWEVSSPYASMGKGFLTPGAAMRFAEFCDGFMLAKRED